LLCVVALLSAGAVAAEERLLFDFEKEALSNQWSAIRNIRVIRDDGPEAPDAEGAPGGKAVQVDTKGSGGLYCKPGPIPTDWRKFSEVSVWVYRSAEEVKARPKSTIEFQMYEADGRARFWRKVEVDHTDWKRVSAPLKWFRRSGRIPQWDRVDRFGVWFRSAAAVSLDNFALTVAPEGETGTRASGREICELAFPDEDAKNIRIGKSRHVRVFTNHAQLDMEKLTDHLDKVTATVFEKLPFLTAPEQPVRLVVFSTVEQYRAFPPRLAQKLASAAAPPSASGFTLCGIATSSWNPTYGTLRPVYTHETPHALLAATARLANSGEWLQEGMANYIQMIFHPQNDLEKIVLSGIADPKKHLPLKDLCSGRPIPMNRGWQALTVVRMLAEDESYREHLPALIAGMQGSGSTQLEPHLKAPLGTDWETLTEDWKAYCRRTYGDDPTETGRDGRAAQ